MKKRENGEVKTQKMKVGKNGTLYFRNKDKINSSNSQRQREKNGGHLEKSWSFRKVQHFHKNGYFPTEICLFDLLLNRSLETYRLLSQAE